MCLNQYPQTNQTRNSYGADLLPNQTHLVFMNTLTQWFRVRVRVGAWMSQCREQSQVGRFTPRPRFIVIIIAQHAQRVRPHAE